MKAHIICVRCEATFEASLTEGKVETALLSEENSSSGQMPPQTQDAPVVSPEQDLYELSAPLETPPPLVQEDGPVTVLDEPVLVLEDVAQTSSSEPDSVLQESQMQETADMQEVSLSPESEPQPVDLEPMPEAPVASKEPPVELGRLPESSLPAHDKYSVGVRLMRVSPLWLLASGLVFISLIALFNWVTKPDAQAHNLTASHVRPNNATNQAAPLQPSPAPVSAEMAGGANPVVEKPAPVVKQPVEAKAAPEVSIAAEVSQDHMRAQATGGFTVQVGSYSDTAQANERAARLTSAGFDAHVVAVELPKRGTWYRVQVGRFTDREAAVRHAAQLRARGAAGDYIITEASVQH